MANIIRNGGASNTTDWTNPTDGLAQYWGHDSVVGTKVYSIVTGNGFTGNAQRFTLTYTASQGSTIFQAATDFITAPSLGSKRYDISFKYRFYDTSGSDTFSVSIIYTDNSTEIIAYFDENTGNATSGSISFNSQSNKTIKYLIYAINCGVNQTTWIEIDEVSMEESDIPTNVSKIRVGSNWEDIDFANSKIMVNGTWRTIEEVKLRTDNGWKVIY